MKISNIALIVSVIALPFVPALAQTIPAQQQVVAPVQTVPVALVRGTIDAIGTRERDRSREVIATVRVRGVTGTSAMSAGEVMRIAYTCSTDRSSPRSCADARNHPAALRAVGPLTLTVMPADVRADELPVPSMQGSMFRSVDGGLASAIVLGAYRGDPGALTMGVSPIR